jgi:hypothetical protein
MREPGGGGVIVVVDDDDDVVIVEDDDDDDQDQESDDAWGSLLADTQPAREKRKRRLFYIKEDESFDALRTTLAHFLGRKPELRFSLDAYTIPGEFDIPDDELPKPSKRSRKSQLVQQPSRKDGDTPRQTDETSAKQEECGSSS